MMTELGQRRYIDYAVLSEAGVASHKSELEDFFCIDTKDEDLQIFGICDGHGGTTVAQEVCNDFPNFLKKHWDDETDKETLLKQLFVQFDKRFADRQNCCGCTATFVIVTPLDIFVANVGDTEAILCTCNFLPITLTSVHSPNKLSEQKRITDLGGHIRSSRVLSNWSVEMLYGKKTLSPNNAKIRIGGLNLSRSFGDYQYTSPLTGEKLISAEPFVKKLSNHGAFAILLASDGMWGHYPRQFTKEQVDVLLETRYLSLCHGNLLSSGLDDASWSSEQEFCSTNPTARADLLQEACSSLIETSHLYTEGKDDTTVMIIGFDLHKYCSLENLEYEY